MSENFYQRIYNKKTSDELREIISNVNSANDSKVMAIDILESRDELTEQLREYRDQLNQKREILKFSEIAIDRYKTISYRISANVVDGFVIGLLGLFYKLFENSDSSFVLKLVQFISVFSPYFYSIIFHGYNGQTIGKMLMGIRIYDKNEKDIISFKQALLRDIIPLGGILVLYIILTFDPNQNLGFLILISLFFSYLLLIWSGLEIITMLFNNKRRALHDFVAGTVVLRIKS